MTDYRAWFHTVTDFSPHDWQQALGDEHGFRHRLIRIPTGLGKTAGTALAWLYHAVHRGDMAWPRRLVFTLPMRVLVEQVEGDLRRWIAAAGLDVDVHVLMGGVRAEPWVLYPEKPQILLGTQDMILSRALCRGYGAARGRWPMDYALLHHDALWVLDEVQLMDVGLCTSAQLAAFRDDDRDTGKPRLRPAACWWMSATLQPRWLETVDAAALLAPLAEEIVSVPPAQRAGAPWTIRKPAERAPEVTTPEAIAGLAAARHTAGTLTLVIVNRVDRAVDVFKALEAQYREGTAGKGKGKGKSKGKPARRPDAPDLRLVHSRFRGVERAAWAESFLSRDAQVPPAMPSAGRIVVATQVVEAGVDISARLLLTELAPWSSLVQRAGRAGRVERDDGAHVIAMGAVADQAGDALPYDPEELAAAAEAWEMLVEHEGDASLAALTRFEEQLAGDDPALLERLYPYQPAQVLRRSDVDELFDTTPDLTGADLDVGAFIRSGEERTVTVAWRDLKATASTLEDKWRFARGDIGKVSRLELCPVPVAEARKWLAGAPQPYVWDYLDGAWVRADPDRIVPGAVLIVPAERGGYDRERGWDPGDKGKVEPVLEVAADAADTADADQRDRERRRENEDHFDDASAAQSHDDSSIASAGAGFKTIATHGRETATIAREEIADKLGLDASWRRLLDLAARWHDAGKAHAVFQAAIEEDGRDAGPPLAVRRDLAKAPAGAWKQPYPYPSRPGFRHELVSTLAMFELLRRAAPDHPALLGGCRAVLDAAGIAPVAVTEAERVAANDPLAAELIALDARSFDLVAYLVCAHHGKVRCAWTSTPADQRRAHGETPRTAAAERDGGQGDSSGQNGRENAAIFGVRDGDALAALELPTASGERVATPALTLHLDGAALGLGGRYGASWTERVSGNRTRLGPFALAYLEALLRAADHRASALVTEDELS